jgi:hypothetical protein
MSLPEGFFRLYTHVLPALKAGDYRFATTQSLNAVGPDGGLAAAALPVEDLQTHLRVTSPRYQLPPDQILSTYPPAGTEGSYGSRLPQVVIKRRTLPWERAVDGGTDGTPWLALVVYAEGEAEVLNNVPVANCVTPGVQLDGPVDVEKGACLEIRTSMVAKIMPTRKDVPLLAHAREVNINDTELMLGDDDGFLAVVISNRLPVAGRSPDGSEAPVKYHAALISLEGPGQFQQLLPKSPPASTSTHHLVLDVSTTLYTVAELDHHIMESTYSTPGGILGSPGLGGSPIAMPGGPHADAADGDHIQSMEATAHRTGVAKDVVTGANSGTGAWQKYTDARAGELVKHGTGTGYYTSGALELFDPKVRFPALAHWTFTSVGNTTFESLMRGADSGLLGTLGQNPATPQGRAPAEVVETGHVGLDQRTRRGDLVRAWYRGPLLPHPADLTGPRLALAHTGDQLRTVIPDGREDLSLASAFEIGRLLALSQPSMVASLLRWRQLGYQAARLGALWDGILGELGNDLSGVALDPGRLLGTAFGRGLARALTKNPGDVIGPPREILTAGTPMAFDGEPITLVAQGFGLDIASDVPLTTMLGALQRTTVPRMSLAELGGVAGTKAVRGALAHVMDASLNQLVAGALSTQIMTHAGAGVPGVIGGPGGIGGIGGVIGGIPVVGPHAAAPDPGPDALDLALQGKAPKPEVDDA